jgi:hypothetical protein
MSARSSRAVPLSRMTMLVTRCTVPLRERPPFLNRCDDGRFYFSGAMVMRSVHKFVYGHKFEGTAAASVVA